MSKKFKMTHIAIREGRAYNAGFKKRTKIRFTKRHIVDEYGQKYSLNTGTPIGESFATYGIDIKSIKEIEVLND